MTINETIQMIMSINTLWWGKLKLDDAGIAGAAKVWQSALENITPEAVNTALNDIVRSGSPFPPTCPEIIGKIRDRLIKDYPPGEVVWKEVVRAITIYGRDRLPEARNTLTEEVMDVIDAIGGWKAICNGNKHDDFVASWTDHVKHAVNEKINGKEGRHRQ